MQKKNHLLISFFLSIWFAVPAMGEESCFYTDAKGFFVSTESKQDVPAEFLSVATCSKKRKRRTRIKSEYQTYKPPAEIREIYRKQEPVGILRPDMVSLGRSKRQKNIQTSLGQVNFRWEASSEKYLGKAAEQTILLGMRAAARVLAQNSFPPELRSENYDWRIVIMDSVPTEVDIDVNGKSACHPGWMRPPADIFLAAERIATSCGQRRLSLEETTIQLEETLVHEIGHAVEYMFLGHNFRLQQRWHKEGFATWFESLAANYISGRGVNKARMRERVKLHWEPNWNPNAFAGTAEEYSRSYAMIATIAEKRSIRRLQQVYQLASERNIPLLMAIEENLHWDKDELFKNVAQHFEVGR